MGDQIEAGAARALATAAFEPSARKVVYVDTVLLAPQEAPVGARVLRAPAPAVLVFCDDKPGATWMHPCRYALVDPRTGTVMARAQSDRPPAFGRLPPSWLVASDPDGLADLVATDRA